MPKTGKVKRGAPTKFTPELVCEILDLIRDGHSERSIFDRPGMPTWTVWCDYKNREHDPERSPDSLFPGQYTRAKNDGMKHWEAKIEEISLDESRDFLTKGNGDTIGNNTAVLRDRLKVDSYKWLMGRIAPKIYGDAIKQEISGPAGGPVPMINISLHDSTKK